MRKLAAILICKLVRFVGSFVGKGSSLPGRYALKICPDILKKVTLPEKIIAVTGSNGKTSTVEMIASVLKNSGLKVAYNVEGSNQIEGVTTMILDNCTLSGRVKADVLLIESDERYAKYTFKWFSPTYYIITNLYRDQLTRNGHPMWVFDAVKESIPDDSTLVLNADDPFVSLFGKDRDNVIWFGVDKCDIDTEIFEGVYNDALYCPACHKPMKYEYYHFNHIGKYLCESCGFKRNDTQYTVTNVDLENGLITIDGNYNVKLAFKSIYNIYNILAAFTACSLAGVEKEKIAALMCNYILKNGRFIRFTLGKHQGTFLVSKHENSISYDMSFKYISESGKVCSVIIIVDAISRKYFTTETSWLWDINFDLLGCTHIKNIYLCGKYCNDLALRTEFSTIDKSKIKVYESIDEACRHIRHNDYEDLYAVTCFSDKAKFLSNIEIK
ncbi:MAG: MurT ligase domain-containing protein [Clostridiales bacterium]|nr:MurT ligase domain-containing protein [Clostridiales bacterium]